MDESTALKIYFWVITGLIAVVGYLIRGWINDRKTKEQKIEERVEKMGQDIAINKKELIERTDTIFSKAVDKFTEAADRLDRTINGLENIVAVIKEQNCEFNRRFERKEKWLAEHESQIKDHSVRIGQIETKCNMQHGKK
jgi:uncharacterized membrane protein